MRSTLLCSRRAGKANVGSFTALAQYLPVTGERWAEAGGCLAFVGATGVGKTTSLAKIAVRWALRELTICVRDLDELPNYARQLVEYLRAKG